ncbi:MAG TPA: aminoacyl-tRNA hydrolase [Candidatus Krumholzibacterium sp.]|nr:aminoacyl-tRNA hydrolase [Candidatus Krumholzibacterium sp.]
MQDILFLCGLGNPGDRYSGTRHNLGFEALDTLARKYRLVWTGEGGRSSTAVWRTCGRKILLIKPTTYMNLSGDALRGIPHMSPDSLLVVCDDMNLLLGQLRIRTGGGTGGHRGLESIEERLGTDRFPRLRMGCGPAPPGEEWSDFVLGGFAAEEEQTHRDMVESAAGAIEMIVRRDLRSAMNEYNRRLETD